VADFRSDPYEAMTRSEYLRRQAAGQLPAPVVRRRTVTAAYAPPKPEPTPASTGGAVRSARYRVNRANRTREDTAE